MYFESDIKSVFYFNVIYSVINTMSLCLHNVIKYFVAIAMHAPLVPYARGWGMDGDLTRRVTRGGGVIEHPGSQIPHKSPIGVGGA